jgi:uncharacterized membrane protein
MYVSASLFSWNHIHPVLVHFSSALIPVSLLSDVLGKYLDRSSLTAAAWWMIVYGAIATPMTAFAGWMWASELPQSASQRLTGLTIHRWLGISLAIAFALITIWRRKIFAVREKPSEIYLISVFLVVGTLMYQGFLGGQMTIG